MGFHIAEAFGRDGRSLTLIDIDPDKGPRIEEELDAAFVVGNGAHQAVLERAGSTRPISSSPPRRRRKRIWSRP